MSELAVTVLRLGLLIGLWALIIAIITSQGRDLMVTNRSKVRGRKAKKAQQAEEAEQHQPEYAAAGAHHAPAHPTTGSNPAVSPDQHRTLPTQLVVTEGPLKDQVIDLNGAPLMLGRAQEADLVLVDDYVSGRHARLFPQGSRWFLEDLGSTNGTYINGAQLSRTVAVDPGVPIRIGKTVMELKA